MRADNEERLVTAHERLAAALERWVNIQDQVFQKQYPVRPDVREALVTRIPSDEDRLRESQGASDEPIEEWTGKREAAFLSRVAKTVGKS